MKKWILTGGILALVLMMLVGGVWAKYVKEFGDHDVSVGVGKPSESTTDDPTLYQKFLSRLPQNQKITALVLDSWENQKGTVPQGWENGIYIGQPAAGSSVCTGDIRFFYVGETGYILAEGNKKVAFPQDSRSLFCDYETEDGDFLSQFSRSIHISSISFNNIDTSAVKEMKYMFRNCRALKELDLTNFDTSNVTTMDNLFSVCWDMEKVTFGNGFNTANVTEMKHMFYKCHRLKSVDLSKFNTAKVTNMESMFAECRNLTEIDLSTFDTSKVTNMKNMFKVSVNLTKITFCDNFASAATTLSGMFYQCGKLENIDLSKFNTANVTNMLQMFMSTGITSLTFPDTFTTENVVETREMFADCKNLTSLDLSGFDTRNVQDMRRMFRDCPQLESLNLSNFVTAQVKNGLNYDTNQSGMIDIFARCTALQEVVLGPGFEFHGTNCYLPVPSNDHIPGADGHWYTPDGTSYTPAGVAAHERTDPTLYTATYDRESKLWNKASLTTIDWKGITSLVFDSWNAQQGNVNSLAWESGTDVSEAADGSVRYFVNGDTGYILAQENCHVRFSADCSALFKGMSFTQIRFNGVDTSNVTTMKDMFFGCKQLTTLYLGNINTVNVTTMSGMFNQCEALVELDIRNMNTSSVTNMSDMFKSCDKLQTLVFDGSFVTTNVVKMKSMFYGCISLKNLNLSHFNTINVTDMRYMFSGCTSLEILNLSDFDTSKITMAVSEVVDTSRKTEDGMTGMFQECNALQQVTLSANFAFVGADCYLPTPAGGSWYTSDGTAYKPEEIPSKTANTYYAVKPT